MTSEQIQNNQEHLYSSIDEMFNDIFKSLHGEMDKVILHIDECVKEVLAREKEGKSITILQKNVLLNLLQQRTNIIKRIDEVSQQKEHVNNILFLHNEKSIKWERS